VAITNVLLWFCIWTPYALVTMIGQFGNPMLVTPLVAQLPAFFGMHDSGDQNTHVPEQKKNSSV
jgi:hypothetical protein